LWLGAVAEKIAEEAGYSRGAFYGNFGDKEDLFLTVIRADYETRFGRFEQFLRRERRVNNCCEICETPSPKKSQNQSGFFYKRNSKPAALRNEKILSVYVELHQQMLRDGMVIFRRLAKVSGIRFKLKPADLLMTMISFSQGLAVNQRLLESELADNSTRKLVWTVFDHFISTESDRRI
jgi:AcrR family transcriptional regulator